MLDQDYRAVGGVAFGSKMDWAIHSDADNHILFFGYDSALTEKVKQAFSANKFTITKEDVITMYSNP